MLHGDALGLLLGAVALGAVHGIEPGHGWPVAASYALDRGNKWAHGLAASLVLGIGHLVSSIAMVGAFFSVKSYFDLTQVNEPVTILGSVELGGPVSLVAGVLLIALGAREYAYGHSHGTHGHDDDRSRDHGDHSRGSGHHDHHEHSGDEEFNYAFVGMDDHDHSHSHDHGHSRHHGRAHDHDGGGRCSRLTDYIPLVGGRSHSHRDLDEAADRGLLGLAWFAFLLGFAHEEEFEIIALCAGSNYCLELMSVYAVTVVVGIVGLTMLLIAGYHQCEERVERYTPYLPAFSAAVLVVMGVGFVVGIL